MKKSRKKFHINKQIVSSFFAGMVAMLMINVGIMSAVNPGFLTGTSASEFVFDETTGTITKYTGNAADVIIPDTINGIRVRSIGNYAFRNYKKLTSIVIPKGVKRIEAFTFNGCKNLTSVTVPSGIIDIGYLAFGTSPNLTIYGSAASYARIYAKDHKIRYVVQ